MKTFNVVDWVAVVLVLVGGLNWGLVGFFDFNLVTAIFGEATVLTRVVYGVVGVATLWLVYALSKGCCGGKCSTSSE